MGSSGLYLGLGPLSPEGLMDLLSSSFMWLLAGGFRSFLCGLSTGLLTTWPLASRGHVMRERERGK